MSCGALMPVFGLLNGFRIDNIIYIYIYIMTICSAVVSLCIYCDYYFFKCLVLLPRRQISSYKLNRTQQIRAYLPIPDTFTSLILLFEFNQMAEQ